MNAVVTPPRGLLSTDALPLYGQIAEKLHAALRIDGCSVGDKLPSERTLAESFGVSRVTLRAALGVLESTGLIGPSHSRGWFVMQALAPSEEERSNTVRGFADYARIRNLRTHARVLDARARPATIVEAETLSVAPGTELFELRRLRYLDGNVVVLEHNRVPLALCPALTVTDFTEASLYATLRAATPPQIPGRASYSVEARNATDDERELLEISSLVPLLVATQVTLGQNGQPIEFTVQAYRGDRYLFQASITD
ncbi:GntR family transcriptional regulator [Glaciibacter psychrotolerans]|uniref:GntR family transcriptional regulator n=1 Tax=Glaciibacter psychrotolerans TaxID=670054 RepID=A0A7Z0EHR8_9MICO|nr:GntR family transcriptional regulator [Leifsonia psychrotolerans]NYJ21475.1 GntR family transcriptional regulator [Leifsonia psychrotolerans]